MRLNNSFFAFFIYLLITGCNAQNPSASKNSESELSPCNNCSVVFYNVENLFDIYDDPEINDEEFLPESEKEWTADRYEKKILDLSKVLAAVNDALPVIIGLSEVENKAVITDLIASADLKNGNYKIIHEDSKDARGIDVAMIYRPEYFEVRSYRSIHVDLITEPAKTTRDILHITGNFKDGSEVHFFINHWPSRYGGQEESEPNRMEAARVLRAEVEKIKENNKNAKVLIMGDLNDYPDNRSISEVLGAGKPGSKNTLLYNLMMDIDTAKSEGSYNYRGDWGFLDQIIVNKNFIKGKGIKVDPNSAQAFREDWMIFQDPKYKDFKPNRTYGGPNYYGGYSDHLPVYVELK